MDLKRSLLALTILLLGCSSATEPGWLRVVGTIEAYGDDPRISLTQEGRTVSISVFTMGRLGCFEGGETEVTVEGLQATVTPFDYHAPPNTHCPHRGETLEHEAILEFETSGVTRITVHGLSKKDDPRGEPMTVELSVTLD